MIWIATCCGMAAAVQVGKASAALPLIRAEFGSGVSVLAAYVSLISVVAALAGFGFGMVSRRVGPRRAALTGLALIVVAGLGGALAGGAPSLIATRLIEAVGFALCTTALPAVIRAATGPGNSSAVMGIWAMWLPGGVATAMALAALSLDPLGWRWFFVLCAAAPALALMTLWRVRTVTAMQDREARGQAKVAPARATGPAPISARTVLRQTELLVAAVFVGFSAGNMILMSFLPTMLVDDMGLTPSRAGLTVMLAMLCMLPMNVATGRMIDRGWNMPLMIAGAVIVIGISALMVTAQGAPDWLRLSGVFGFGIGAGVPPAAIWGSIPLLAKRPSDAPLLSGLFYQGAGLGQVSGPILAGLVLTRVPGWWVASWCVAGMMAVTVGLTLWLARSMAARRQT
ncbi:MAG: MFS transporter [Celeribacter sp.]|jgi:MFS family permease